MATGSSPAVLPIPGLEQIRSLTTESIFDLETLPAQLIVVGTERAGLELAQAFRRLGSEVTILEPGKALTDEDPELADILLVQLAREGIVLHENVEILRVEPHKFGCAGHSGRQKFSKKRSMVCTFSSPPAGCPMSKGWDSRRPASPSARAASFSAATCAVRTVAFMRSAMSAARRSRAPAASYQAALVLRAGLMHLPARIEPALVPRVTFTDPEIAVAGLRERRRRVGAMAPFVSCAGLSAKMTVPWPNAFRPAISS